MYDFRFFLHSPQLIRFTKPRMRLRTPRLLVKVVSTRNQRRSGGDAASIDATGRKKRNRKWGESGNLLPRKIGSVFCNTFCSTKAAELAYCGARKINMLKEVVADRLRGDQTVLDRSKEMSKSQSSFKKILGIKDRNSKGETKNQENLGLLSRFSGMFRLKKKKTGFSFRKWKISRKSCMKSFARIPSRPRGYMQIHSPKFIQRKMRKPEDKEEETELCKKRILMGDKCKPLNISGSLHYDKNGVLLPELLPCE